MESGENISHNGECPVFHFHQDAVYGDFVTLRGYGEPLVYVFSTCQLIRIDQLLEELGGTKANLLHECLMAVIGFESVDAAEPSYRLVDIVSRSPIDIGPEYVGFGDGFDGCFVACKQEVPIGPICGSTEAKPVTKKYVLDRKGAICIGPYREIHAAVEHKSGFYLVFDMDESKKAPYLINRKWEMLIPGEMDFLDCSSRSECFIGLYRPYESGSVDVYRYVPDDNQLVLVGEEEL